MVLFLDFDGVLHPDPPNSSNPLWCRTDLLVDWLNARPEVEIVVSSTWRRTYNFQELQDLVPPGLACKLVGCTGLVQEELYARQRECDHLSAIQWHQLASDSGIKQSMSYPVCLIATQIHPPWPSAPKSWFAATKCG
jgi:hypothetical protein